MPDEFTPLLVAEGNRGRDESVTACSQRSVRRQLTNTTSSSALSDRPLPSLALVRNNRFHDEAMQDRSRGRRRRASDEGISTGRFGLDPPESQETERSNNDEDGNTADEGMTSPLLSTPSKPDDFPESKYSKPRFWIMFITVLLSYFVAHFDLTLMASSHPFITSYFNAANQASWLTTGFLITNTGFQPLWGRLSDATGRKLIYLTALAIFALMNVWCGTATTVGSFIAARTICGIGAGGTMSMGLVITNDLVRIEHRGTYLSHINLVSGIGSTCGAAFGGYICETFGWRWAFGIQVQIFMLCGVMAIIFIPNELGPASLTDGRKSDQNSTWATMKDFDSMGLAALILSAALLVLSLNIGGNEVPWTHPLVIICLILGITLGWLAIRFERKARNPVMPLHLISTSPHMNLTYSNFLAGLASNAVLFNAPIWFQAVDLVSASTSGLRLTAPTIGGSIAAVVTGNMITYTGRLKPMLVLGAAIYVVGSLSLGLISRYQSAVVQVLFVTPIPLSQGFIYPASMMGALAVSPQADQGVVVTSLSLWRNLGIVLGVAISGLVFQNSLTVFLTRNVHGPEAKHFIRVARSNIGEVRKLPEMYRDQVIDSYASALKLSFVAPMVASLALLLITIPVKLPRLRRDSNQAIAENNR